MAKTVHSVGILNITPDSFSDGGQYLDPEVAVSHAQKLIEGGAAFVDVGADSTRPGSVCAGDEEEWRRLAPVLERLTATIPVSVDTHFYDTARRALYAGAKIINDISGGSREMFELAADTNAKLVTVYSRCTSPHDFSAPALSGNQLIDAIRQFFDRKIDMAAMIGLPRTHLFFDPGMGSFISDDPVDSALLIENIAQLKDYFPLFIGLSRKKFVEKLWLTGIPDSDDWSSASIDDKSSFAARHIVQSLPDNTEVYFRVHDLPSFNKIVTTTGGV